MPQRMSQLTDPFVGLFKKAMPKPVSDGKLLPMHT